MKPRVGQSGHRLDRAENRALRPHALVDHGRVILERGVDRRQTRRGGETSAGVATPRIYQRYYTPPGRGDTNEHGSRAPVAKDRDRIVHSGALRRLQRKSQIVGVQADDFFRTRLTHTYECAQIGRAIALRSTKSDWKSVVTKAGDLPDLVEAACLAHDLCHPPFGHNGERALQTMMERHARGLFEGNAQSFRVVSCFYNAPCSGAYLS
jgi:dGTP triphosphohydrolase